MGGARATVADAATCPDYLLATSLRDEERVEGVYHEFDGVWTEWPLDPHPHIDRTLRRVAKKIPKLREFFETCQNRSWQIHCTPPPDAL